MSAPGPFDELGIAPTLDPAMVKRAYFRQLALRPPHRDPEGFRRLRAAYEALGQGGALAAAYFDAPLDLETELGARAHLGERVAAAAAAQRTSSEDERTLRRFTEAIGTASYEQLVALFRGT